MFADWVGFVDAVEDLHEGVPFFAQSEVSEERHSVAFLHFWVEVGLLSTAHGLQKMVNLEVLGINSSVIRASFSRFGKI